MPVNISETPSVPLLSFIWFCSGILNISFLWYRLRNGVSCSCFPEKNHQPPRSSVPRSFRSSSFSTSNMIEDDFYYRAMYFTYLPMHYQVISILLMFSFLHTYLMVHFFCFCIFSQKLFVLCGLSYSSNLTVSCNFFLFFVF